MSHILIDEKRCDSPMSLKTGFCHRTAGRTAFSPIKSNSWRREKLEIKVLIHSLQPLSWTFNRYNFLIIPKFLLWEMCEPPDHQSFSDEHSLKHPVQRSPEEQNPWANRSGHCTALWARYKGVVKRRLCLKSVWPLWQAGGVWGLTPSLAHSSQTARFVWQAPGTPERRGWKGND